MLGVGFRLDEYLTLGEIDVVDRQIQNLAPTQAGGLGNEDALSA